MPEVTKKQHHALVRISHWLTVAVLTGLVMSGLSIYWAAPVLAPLPQWLYDHFSFGRQNLAGGLRAHWLFAYVFMLCGLLYAIGLIAGRGWRALMPRRGDFSEALAMVRYYTRLDKTHPVIETKYNALQRASYLSMPIFGLLAILSGWAMHKPVQLWWLERMFGSYDGARIVHFLTMWVFIAFVVPHVILVIVDGWGTFRSMVTTDHARRDFVLFGLGIIGAFAGFRYLRRGGFRGVLRFDDDVAEALYSPTRSVRTYAKHDVTPLRNNYEGKTPGPEYLATWTLTLSGLASGHDVTLRIEDLLGAFAHHEQVTRLVCVEGWSAIAWWGGLRFDDLLRAYPPAPGARWAAIESAVNLDWRGGSDPYYVSIDLPTARHAQSLLATHYNGARLTVAHGAPLRLVVPMKLGLKNIKAITRIAYTSEEPKDYWGERGYSAYDGL